MGSRTTAAGRLGTLASFATPALCLGILVGCGGSDRPPRRGLSDGYAVVATAGSGGVPGLLPTASTSAGQFALPVVSAGSAAAGSAARGSSRNNAGRSASGGVGAAVPNSPASAGSDANLTWRTANLTHFTSYPEPGSDECVKYMGCMWAGQFAGVKDKQTEQWVKEHNILAVHSKDFAMYKLKTLRVRKGSHQIDAIVYDQCNDADCSGCCTQNSQSTGFLIDAEKYTSERLMESSGVVEWACLDCN